ncbi:MULTISPECIES: CapA family protein [unclassified Gemella]|uniref:CapA family protein n=1 Tax=unclassified Gemella TaxID=2624949 RepID=UPI00210291D2|nr:MULTISPECIES: CapA family protein [unclassified Gemella]
MKNNKKSLIILGFIFLIISFGVYFIFYHQNGKDTISSKTEDIKTVQIVANGDILYHDVLYWSAKDEKGNYNFDPYFEYVRDRISEADLAIGDYEGTISDKHSLSGYPLI